MCLILKAGTALPKVTFREAELVLDVYDENVILKLKGIVNLNYFEGIYQLLMFSQMITLKWFSH